MSNRTIRHAEKAFNPHIMQIAKKYDPVTNEFLGYIIVDTEGYAFDKKRQEALLECFQEGIINTSEEEIEQHNLVRKRQEEKEIQAMEEDFEARKREYLARQRGYVLFFESPQGIKAHIVTQHRTEEFMEKQRERKIEAMSEKGYVLVQILFDENVKKLRDEILKRATYDASTSHYSFSDEEKRNIVFHRQVTDIC